MSRKARAVLVSALTLAIVVSIMHVLVQWAWTSAARWAQQPHGDQQIMIGFTAFWLMIGASLVYFAVVLAAATHLYNYVKRTEN